MKKISRRDFVQTSSLALASLGLVAAPHNEVLTTQKPKTMFVHHVYFWLKNPGSAEDRARLLKGIQTLKNIEVIKTIHIGVPAATNRDVIDRSYAFSQMMIFDNAKDQDTYQTHPIHLKFVEEYSSLWSKVIVYDSIDA